MNLIEENLYHVCCRKFVYNLNFLIIIFVLVNKTDEYH